MPHATNRGQRIHYTVEGSGPLVVLQHGFLSSGNESWMQSGIVNALSDRFQVAYVDSLGHGFSDKPADPALYSQEQRAADLVAVIDDLDTDRAHLIGYSMGGWMSVGVAKYHPERLASLTLGGWDLVKGGETARPAGFETDVTFEQVIGALRSMAPALVEWVSPEVEPGLRACWARLTELDGAEKAVLSVEVPKLLWNGRDDPYHDPMKAFSVEHGLRFLSTPGDHISAVQVHGAEAGRGLRDFLLSQ